MKLDTILVPLDGSPLAEAALATALDLVDPARTTVRLLRAAEARTLSAGDPIEAQVLAVREAEAYLERVAGAVRARGVARVETSAWYGDPATAIAEAAEFGPADLIVMSTHGRSGLGRLVMGSVTEAVLRSTRTPLLIVRPGPGGRVTPMAAATPEATHV